jgi:ferrous iron transport protein A
MQSLKEAKIGETVWVVKLHGEGAVKRRIMDMGLTKGTPIYVRKKAPLGDPLELRVRGYELSIRGEDAAMVEVEEREEDPGWK